MGCFADDAAFWTVPSESDPINYRILQRKICRFNDWTKYWQLCLNPDKCVTFNLAPSKHRQIAHQHHTDETEASSTNIFKYLGLWIEKDLTFKTHVDKVQSCLQRNLQRMLLLLRTRSKLLPETVMEIYNAKTRSIAECTTIIRCGYPGLWATPIDTIQTIANVQRLSIRYQQLVLRH